MTAETPHGIHVRRATPADADALIELRALMFAAMGVPGINEPGWRQGAKDWLQRELAQRHTSASLAVDANDTVLAAALGTLRFELPSPTNPSGVWGLVSNVATWPHARRRGLARACVADVLEWLRHETPAGAAELMATGDGSALYEQLGFTRTTWPAMRLRIVR